MEYLSLICKWAAILLSAYTIPLALWMLYTALRGFGKQKPLVPREEKFHSFAVVVCARNEETVIGNLLESLNRQEYAGRYRIFVVADNCTDNTAAIAERYGAAVFRRNDPEKRGKGYALRYGLNRIRGECSRQYDAFCVFDADNLASPGFLTQINLALCSGADVALGYRDSKNTHDSWVSEACSLYWLMLTRFYHTPRHKMGISSMVGGTGFAFLASALGVEGWQTSSLTEDVEFSIQQILLGRTIVPARKAVYYDEQPTTLAQSFRQRLRWVAGGIQCIPLYLPRVLRSAFSGNPKALDAAWYLLFILAAGLALPLQALTFTAMWLDPALQAFAIPALLGGLSATFALSWFIALSTLKLENKKIVTMWRAVLLYPIFMFTMTVIAFAALVRRDTEWKPIRHESRYTIKEMEN